MSDIRFNRWLHQSGTGGVYQDSSGRVGIGTSVPTSALDVQSGTIKIGSNTLSSTGVSTFSTLTATTITGVSTIGVTTVHTRSIVGVSTAGITTAYVTSINDGPLSGARNRIINGDMRIDQRNNGASVTPTTDGGSFPVDRWLTRLSQTSKYSVQQNSSIAPAGFTHSLAVTSLSAYSIGAGDYFALEHRVEGFNISDLAWGTSSASSARLSFWVRSSLTGTFGGAIVNGSLTPSYPFTYSITAANTWEYKTISISGPTSGVWNSSNGRGLSVIIGLGVGSSLSFGTAGAWSNSTLFSAPGATSVVGTNGATFYITGVQLESGTVSTPFERRPYGQELALAQRYFYSSTSTGTNQQFVNQRSNSSGNYGGAFPQLANFPVQMRAAPVVTTYTNNTRANPGNFLVNGSTVSSQVSNMTSTIAFMHWNGGAIPNVGDYYSFYLDANIEL